MHDYTQISHYAAIVASEAGKLLKDAFGSKLNVSHKGDVDLVTEMDLASEKLIKQRLTSKYPQFNFYGEENGGEDWKKGMVWVVDPLDGTTNYANGLSHFCVSIALCKDGVPMVAAIYSPVENELYTASRGGGAFLNNTLIKVSDETLINQALAVTGFPYNRRECMDEMLSYLRAMMMHVQGIRRFGSAALDLCYVAQGTFSIFWEMNLKPWDIAAGSLLVEEAGGQISKFNGEDMPLDGCQILATNKHLHKQAVNCLQAL